jgi:hypothetical protein
MLPADDDGIHGDLSFSSNHFVSPLVPDDRVDDLAHGKTHLVSLPSSCVSKCLLLCCDVFSDLIGVSNQLHNPEVNGLVSTDVISKCHSSCESVCPRRYAALASKGVLLHGSSKTCPMDFGV